MSSDAQDFVFDAAEAYDEYLLKEDKPKALENEWVSVKDRLPDDGVYFLACFHFPPRQHEKQMQVLRAMPSGVVVTHWMPLPAPPRNENESI